MTSRWSGPRVVIAGVAVVTACAGSVVGASGSESSWIVLDDFESGSLAGWREAGGGAGGWFVYSDGTTAPEPEWTDGIDPFAVPDPPQGEFAVVTDMNNPGTRIMYRDVTLNGPGMLHLTVFYEVGHRDDGSLASFITPDTLRFDAEPNLQFRIDLLDLAAPFDSVADGDVLVNVFGTEASDPASLEPTEVSVDVSELAGQTVRLRLAETGNQAPVRAGVDDIRFEPSAAAAGIELPATSLAPGLPDAAGLALPEPTGPHRVGTNSQRVGELGLSLWFPTEDRDGPPAPYVTPEQSRQMLAGPDVYGVPPDILAATRTHAVANAEPLDRVLPLVVLSPGAGLPGSSLSGLAVDLASRGYAVAAIDHTEDADIAPTASDRAAEVSLVLDELIDGELRVDTDRIAVVGHSFGGAAALLAVRDDPRLLAGVNLDGTFFPALNEDLDRPFLMVSSGPGDASWTTTWAHLTGWRGWLTVAGANHMSFIDDPILFDQLGFGDPDAALTVDRAASITRDVVAAFVDLHLSGIPQPLLEAPSRQYPEITSRVGYETGDAPPTDSTLQEDNVAEGSSAGSLVMDDFESGALDDWRAVSGGSGGWFVYSDGQTAPDPEQSDPNFPFAMPDPPQGEFAAVTDMAGPGTRILYRDVMLDGELTLHATVFYEGSAPFSTPDTLAFDAAEPNQQFRIDLVDPAAPIDSVADGDVLANVFRTEAADPVSLEPTEVSIDVSDLAGQMVRLRLAQTDNSGPMRAGVDDIRFEPIGGDAGARIQLPATPEATDAIDLVLHRLTEAEALAALSVRAGELAEADEFSGAVLIARDGEILLENAWGFTDREAGVPNTPDTRFRIGSMNKMFTAVVTLQLVEAGELALDEPIATYLTDYPNTDLASKVTVRHLLTHTGGTGDFFGPEFDQHRLELREHGDYLNLFGERGVLFEPGSRWEYSNYGFILLGAIIEAVTGQSYYDYVREHVFQPAGMTSTDSLPEDDNVPGRAVAYWRPTGEWAPATETLPYRGTAAGGGYSTVGDLFRFAEALQAGTLLSPELLAEATSPQGEEFYGYGFDVGTDPSSRFGHGGGAPGMNGELRVFPELGYVVVVLSNLDPPAASTLADFFTMRMPVGPRATRTIVGGEWEMSDSRIR